jgi:hypothetical protein
MSLAGAVGPDHHRVSDPHGRQPACWYRGRLGRQPLVHRKPRQQNREITPPCVANDTTLCLSASRFRVTADFETPDGRKGTAHAKGLTANTGYFWFFDHTNVEVVTKVLLFCADPFNSIWILAAGLTNVKVELTYTDTDNGTVVTKKNDLGVPFAPVQDTSAFQTCP